MLFRSALLLSSIGVPIAKHGNRAASSMSGSSDIVSHLNIRIETDEKKIHKLFKKNNFVYLNAPLFYPDLKKVANVRKMFETKTIFNYMGPTLNPLKAKYQLLGTFNRFSAEILNKILFNINLKSYNIFYSHEGLDASTQANGQAGRQAGRVQTGELNPGRWEGGVREGAAG